MSDDNSLTEQLAELRARARERGGDEWVAMQQRAMQETDQQVAASALGVGDIAPDFTLRRAEDNREVNLYRELTNGPAVLSFYRGQWCPYCNLELRALDRHAEDIRAAGAQVFSIGPETQEKATEMLQKTEASIPVLYDLDGSVMTAYGVDFALPEFLRERYERFGFPDQNELTGWRLPVPATYIVGRGRIIHERHFDADYTQRMDPLEIVAAVRRLESAPPK